MFADCRTEWRINDVERKADRAESRLHELDSIRRDVDSLERTTRELSSEVYGLRSELQAALDRIRNLEEANIERAGNAGEGEKS